MTTNRGYILVLSSPSGAGKSTLARQLLQDDDLTTPKLSVSVTTRPRRPSEIDGTHYHFIDEATFMQRRDQGALLEWAEVHGTAYYGTPREPVEQALTKGQIVLFDIDWQGTEQVRAAMPEDTVSVFILPPSFEELRARIIRRAEDKPEDIEKRLTNARDEMTHWRDYDYVITNTDLNEAYRQLRAIYIAETVRRTRQPGLDSFVDELISGD